MAWPFSSTSTSSTTVPWMPGTTRFEGISRFDLVLDLGSRHTFAGAIHAIGRAEQRYAEETENEPPVRHSHCVYYAPEVSLFQCRYTRATGSPITLK